jgi:hypothetical protein
MVGKSVVSLMKSISGEMKEYAVWGSIGSKHCT